MCQKYLGEEGKKEDRRGEERNRGRRARWGKKKTKNKYYPAPRCRFFLPSSPSQKFFTLHEKRGRKQRYILLYTPIDTLQRMLQIVSREQWTGIEIPRVPMCSLQFNQNNQQKLTWSKNIMMHILVHVISHTLVVIQITQSNSSPQLKKTKNPFKWFIEKEKGDTDIILFCVGLKRGHAFSI